MYSIWLKECNKESSPLVGGKNANLGELINANLRVPPGFAITTKAYKEMVLRQGGIEEKICRILSHVYLEDIDSVNKASEEVCYLIESITLPSQVEKVVESYYRSLGKQCGMDNLPVSVRSSATAEDLPGASFAGQHDTYLWICGQEAVKSKIIKCWSSLFSPRAICYRVKMGFPHEKVSISVGVQKMVNSRTAGVIFTLNPMNGDPSKIFISGSWGFGESVVSGEVTPDEWMVDKVTFEIIKRTISPKLTERVVNGMGEVTTLDVPPERQEIACLSDEEVMELARLAKCIEKHYGAPQDIEWAIDGDGPFPENVFILQTRPETVFSHREAKPVAESSASALDYLTKLLKPCVKA